MYIPSLLTFSSFVAKFISIYFPLFSPLYFFINLLFSMFNITLHAPAKEADKIHYGYKIPQYDEMISNFKEEGILSLFPLSFSSVLRIFLALFNLLLTLHFSLLPSSSCPATYPFPYCSAFPLPPLPSPPSSFPLFSLPLPFSRPLPLTSPLYLIYFFFL